MDNINVTRSTLPPYEEYCAEIRELWDSRWLTNMGAKHEKLRLELKNRLGSEHLELFTNGHLSIESAIEAMGLAGEVITTPFTFASTTHAIVRSGLDPIFCDIDPANFTIDATKIESLITEKTSAILPVHVYGNVCDVEAIQHIAKKYHLKVIYDAAHTFGVRYKGRSVGNFGDASCFSFHATKVFHTIEGGAVAYRDEDFGRRLAKLKNFGLDGPDDASEIGGNAKLDEFRAAMGLCDLRHIDEEIATRKRVVERYREQLGGVPGIQLNPIQPDVMSNYAYFPIVINEAVFGADRSQVMTALAAQSIHARKYFYPLTSEFSCYKGRFDPGRTPIAKQVSRRVLTLPLYPELPLDIVDRICGIVLSCKK